MPALLILIPLFGLIALNLPFVKESRRATFWFAVFVFFVQIALSVYHHPMFWKGNLTPLDPFFRIDLTADHLSFIVLLSIGIVCLSSLVTERYTIIDERERFYFKNLLIVSAIGMSGMVMVRDIFSLYVFLEITSVAAFLMISIERGVLALEGAFKYMILSIVASVFMLTGIAMMLFISNDLSFFALREAFISSGQSKLAMTAVALFLCGLFIKGGVFPFHGWLPDAYSAAPAAASVLLAGIITKVSGIYAAIRLVGTVFGFTAPVTTVLMAAGTASIIIGALGALVQNDMKRMLAYSSISQIGYILLGFGAGTELGFIGGVFHFFNHAIFKSLLFVNSAAVEYQTGTRDMNKVMGLSEKMPVTGTTSVIGLLSICGVPPLSGFWSKLIIVVALWKAGHPAYASVAVLASVLTLGYMLFMQRRVFFGRLPEDLRYIKEAGAGMVFVSLALALITVLAGILFPWFYGSFLVFISQLG